jgi:hypothetical protein
VDVTSKEPKLFLPAGEVDRLRRILDEAPGPTNLDRTKYRMVRGPKGTKLHWTSYPDTGWEKLLRDVVPLMGPALLRMGLHCYALTVADDRLLIWRQIRMAPPSAVLRVSLFDTTALEPIGRLPRSRPGDPVIHKAGLLGEIDLPGNWERGLQTVPFPEPMHKISDFLLLGHVICGWSPGLSKAAMKARRMTVIYVARPARSEVEVLPLDWASPVEGRLHWIARVARDSITGKIIGDGAGVRPFLLDDRGGFLGWIRATDVRA